VNVITNFSVLQIVENFVTKLLLRYFAFMKPKFNASPSYTMSYCLINTIIALIELKIHVFGMISVNEILKTNSRGDQNEALETAYLERRLNLRNKWSESWLKPFDVLTR
jgi:hypothetical protein